MQRWACCRYTRENGHELCMRMENRWQRYWLSALLLGLLSMHGVVPVTAGVTKAQASAATTPGRPALSADQRAYLDQLSPLQVCADPHYYPLDFIDEQGRHQGAAADLLDALAVMLDVSLQVVPSDSWSETLELAKAGHCDLVAMLNKTPERAEYLVFSQPYLSFPNVFVSHRPAYFHGLDSLVGETVALPSGFRMEEVLRHQHPEVEILPVKNISEALQRVNQGEASVTILNQRRVLEDIQRLGLRNLHFAGDALAPDYYRLGVPHSHEPLLGIFNQALEQLPSQEKARIMERWMVVALEPATDWRMVIGVLAVASLIVLVLALYLYNRRRFYRLLEAKNHELQRLSETDMLTGIANRRRLDARLDEEILRAVRYQRPLAVILADIDYFKEINDRFGHQMGDQVLVAVSQCLRGHLRHCDLAGRWGGDELLVICPETSAEQAEAVAEKIRQQVARLKLRDELNPTLTLGVAGFVSGDAKENLVGRADRALYRAKAKGRNTVCR